MMYKLIVADDEPVMLRMMEKIIDWENFGFELAGAAEDGISAFELIKKEKPRLAIVDIRMPGLSGIDIAKKIRDEHIDCAVIVITAYMDIEYARSSLKYGVKYFLTKPFEKEELCAALDYYKNAFDREQAAERIIKQSRTHNEKKTECPADRAILAVRSDKLDGVSDMIIYEHTPGIISFLVESDGDLNTEVRKCFDKASQIDNSAYAVSAARKAYATETECCNAALNSLVRLTAPERGRIYPAQEHKMNTIKSYEFRRYAEKLKQAVEFMNRESVENILSEFFSILSDCKNPMTYAWIFYSYVIIYVNRILFENNIESEQLIKESRETVKATLHDYYMTVLKLCADGMDALVNIEQTEHISLFNATKQYITEHFRESMIIKDIAKDLYASPGYLGTVFSQNMGVNIREYINKLRMEETLRLMNETDLGMSEIAYQVGYNNYNYFYMQFEKHFGMPPLKYKRSLETD